MSLTIDDERFEIANDLFLHHMVTQSKGIPFTGFQHPFLFDDEIAYKLKIYGLAKAALNLSKWHTWKKSPGKIIAALKTVCHPSVSANLLEHRFGPESYSESPLYKVKDLTQIRDLEDQMYLFFWGGTSNPSEVGNRFDQLTQYLKENHLGCKWPFMAYLCFLLSPQQYFPILPTRFDRLLKFYGLETSLVGNVSWHNYSILLELADLLRSKLSIYGQISAVEIQSYMWVVSYLLARQKKIPKHKSAMTDPSSKLAGRIRRAQERERIGFLGEQFIYKQEIDKLMAAGRTDLAKAVRWLSIEGEEFAYDILSFEKTGQEIHLEVKTTTRSSIDDDGFWVSAGEKQLAEQDQRWTICRVWGIDSIPSYQNLGNVILNSNDSWELTAANWYVHRKVPDKQ